jgi:hypothetical protein
MMTILAIGGGPRLATEGAGGTQSVAPPGADLSRIL